MIISHLLMFMFFRSLLLIPVFLVCSSLLSVFYFRKQLLVGLLGLELVNLILFLGVILKFYYCGQFISYSFFLLILGACEARLGLRLIISMTRFKGNDMLRELSTFKC